jgi:hypothetical protein
MTGALRKVGVALLVAAMIGSLVLVAATPALTKPIKVRIKFGVSDRTVKRNQEIVFFGRLKSKKKKCIRFSKVYLKRKGVGVVDVDRTDREGEFRFRIDPQPNRGRYFARFRGKKINKPGYGYGYGYGGGKRRCGKATSRVIRIRPAHRP